jgi:hypothetical protein
MWIEQGIKWAVFLKESTKVVIQSKPSTVGKPVMSSMLIIFQGRVALGRGRSEPSGIL